MNLYEIASFVIYALLAMFALLGSAWLCLDIFNRVKDSIRPMISEHGKSIALKTMSLPFRMFKKIGARLYWLSMLYAMTTEEKSQRESNSRVHELENKLQELNMLAIYLSQATPWPVFTAEQEDDDVYVDNCMAHYDGELEGTREYIQNEVDRLYKSSILSEWKRALKTITNRYGHNVADPNIQWYTVHPNTAAEIPEDFNAEFTFDNDEFSEEDIADMEENMEWSHIAHLKNKICLVSDTYDYRDTTERVMCSKCLLHSAEFIKVVGWQTDNDCACCGHKDGEEFPENNEEE